MNSDVGEFISLNRFMGPVDDSVTTNTKHQSTKALPHTHTHTHYSSSRESFERVEIEDDPALEDDAADFDWDSPNADHQA
jgi:hypothetical protein